MTSGFNEWGRISLYWPADTGCPLDAFRHPYDPGAACEALSTTGIKKLEIIIVRSGSPSGVWPGFETARADLDRQAIAAQFANTLKCKDLETKIIEVDDVARAYTELSAVNWPAKSGPRAAIVLMRVTK